MATDTTKYQSWVQKTPGVCGGRACIRKARITEPKRCQVPLIGFLMGLNNGT